MKPYPTCRPRGRKSGRKPSRDLEAPRGKGVALLNGGDDLGITSRWTVLAVATVRGEIFKSAAASALDSARMAWAAR